jgi:putative membrane protein
MRTYKDYFFIKLKGMAMGAADVVPGVSGGTIAFIAGIYEELINSIKSINPDALKVLFKDGFKVFWKKINGNFLLSLVTGIFLSVILFSRGILYLLENHPILLWSFFFGLILASALVVGMSIIKWNYAVLAAIFAGTAIAYSVTVISPAETPTDWWFFFLSGMIAICAMILPGVSGSFILLLMGKYEQLLTAIKNMEIVTIALFGAGCVVGLLGFSHLLSWMFRKFRDITIAFLSGFMIGSLNKVWPWKQTLEYRINSKDQEVPFIQENLLPGQFTEITGEPSFVISAILVAIAGFALIYLLEKVIGKKLAVQ